MIRYSKTWTLTGSFHASFLIQCRNGKLSFDEFKQVVYVEPQLIECFSIDFGNQNESQSERHGKYCDSNDSSASEKEIVLVKLADPPKEMSFTDTTHKEHDPLLKRSYSQTSCCTIQ